MGKTVIKNNNKFAAKINFMQSNNTLTSMGESGPVIDPIHFSYQVGIFFKTQYSIEATMDFIRISSEGFFSKQLEIIPTHRISGINYGFRSSKILLLLAVTSAILAIISLLGVFSPSTNFANTLFSITVWLTLSVAFILAYLSSRRQFIAIISEERAKPLNFLVGGVNQKPLIRFIENVQKKYAKILQKNRKTV